MTVLSYIIDKFKFSFQWRNSKLLTIFALSGEASAMLSIQNHLYLFSEESSIFMLYIYFSIRSGMPNEK